MAASHGAKVKLLKQHLDKSNQNLYMANRYNDMQVVQVIEENISNLKKEIEQFERRYFFEDTANHQMPPPAKKL